jgi:N-acetylmuramoyl-L-alanine amidase
MEDYLVILGHGESDPGASGNGTNERDFMRGEFYTQLKKYANKSKTKSISFYNIHRNSYRQKAMLDIDNDMGVVELHLDGANASAKGGHVIIHKAYEPDALDNRFADLIKRHFGWRNANKKNGIDKRDNLYNLNVSKARGINYRLLELGFISNKVNMNYFRKHVDVVAREIIEAITGENLKDEKFVKHYVRLGDNLTHIARDYNTTIDSIVRLNHISNRNHIVVGQTLTIIKGDK